MDGWREGARRRGRAARAGRPHRLQRRPARTSDGPGPPWLRRITDGSRATGGSRASHVTRTGRARRRDLRSFPLPGGVDFPVLTQVPRLCVCVCVCTDVYGSHTLTRITHPHPHEDDTYARARHG